jgi:hypothetical protein
MPFARSLIVVLGLVAIASAETPSLPKYSEEREAAARFFVKKHCPELTPLLDELKKANRAAYEEQIRETFQVTEILSDLQDDPKRYALELRIWKAENKAIVLVAKLATPKESERKSIEKQLETLARELVDLEIQGMEHQVDVLERELTAAREDLARTREGNERMIKERFESLLEKARKKRRG